jgi:hypothetical protein
MTGRTRRRLPWRSATWLLLGSVAVVSFFGQALGPASLLLVVAAGAWWLCIIGYGVLIAVLRRIRDDIAGP